MGAYRMKIDYSKLFEKLKNEGITQTTFKKEAKISANTLVKLLHNESVTTESICKICDFFCCMPDEIMDWQPESYYKEKRNKKEKLQKEIERLQKQIDAL